MTKKTDLPKELQALVQDVGRPVTSDDIDAYRELQRIKDETHQLRTVLKAWKDQQIQDQKLRYRYGTGLLIALGVQLLLTTAQPMHQSLHCEAAFADGQTATTLHWLRSCQ